LQNRVDKIPDCSNKAEILKAQKIYDIQKCFQKN